MDTIWRILFLILKEGGGRFWTTVFGLLLHCIWTTLDCPRAIAQIRKPHLYTINIPPGQLIKKQPMSGQSESAREGRLVNNRLTGRPTMDGDIMNGYCN